MHVTWLKEFARVLADPSGYYGTLAERQRSVGPAFTMVSVCLAVNAAALYVWGSRMIQQSVPDFVRVMFTTSLLFSLFCVALGGYFTWLAGSLAVHAVAHCWRPPVPCPVGDLR